MEGIQKIKDRILQEAGDEREKILNEARDRAREIKERAGQRAAEVEKQIAERARKEAEEEKRKILSMARLEQRKALLEVKQQIIDEVFEKAQRELENLPAKDYQNLVVNMLVKSAITGDEEVIISEKDKEKITPDQVEKANRLLKAQGKAGMLKLSGQTRPMIGGVVLRSKDLEVNCTFDSLIKMQREELETEIAKILFEE
ncbi:V-type ATP synthase subunit E [Thermoanaerobacterium sp. DL9XJH110]|uniref:V-type ATP synthase subunit E n=1 Tax=Thermoanaerobacterium sp. DL9XJH110 TaxID=3386643 RepID=UPI003BB5432F